MLEQIIEEKSSRDFLQSEKYAMLQKEVADSMASVGVFERKKSGDQDMAPEFDYFVKQLVKNGLSEVRAEKLFWRTAAEQIRETHFREIYKELQPYIGDLSYPQARFLLMEELKNVIEKASSTLYRNLSRRNLALTVLKEEFYGLFPEIEALLEETEEEKRAKIKVPAGRLGEKQEGTPLLPEKGFRESSLPSYLVEERYWEVPDHQELIPGLIIVFEYKEVNQFNQTETTHLETMEFLDIPRLGKERDFFVKVRWSGEVGLINLADFGLLAYRKSGLWNSYYIPKRWGMKKRY